MPFSSLKFILGPTNTGKTFYALDRMIGYQSGMIGFPLRLLARENYDKLVAKLGPSHVALITGEEKIIPTHAKYFCCTVESMPRIHDVECLIVDEIQLCGDKERGHIFTHHLLHARGKYETLFLGAQTIKPLLKTLFPAAEFIHRPRLSRLSYTGHKKITRLPRRSAIIAFSTSHLYHLAEFMRNHSGGVAVVMGALSPHVRNAQVALFENGDVDFMIATDAIGMGLNMNIDHIALADNTKFDGQKSRYLESTELAQIAGRAGRYVRDGTFGTTQTCPMLDQKTIEAIESHDFLPLQSLWWRNNKLHFSSLTYLIKSLEQAPPYSFMTRKSDAIDHKTLVTLAKEHDIRRLADNPERVRLLWEVAQIPDFCKTMTDSHALMLIRIFNDLVYSGQIDKDWMARQLDSIDTCDGDIDILMTRIAHIRTWTYIAHKSGWTQTCDGWQDYATSIEDKLSQELHHRLTQKFVDRRVAHLSRRLGESKNLTSSIRLDGTVFVEGEEVGILKGFLFIPHITATHEKATITSVARKALPDEIERRVAALSVSADAAFHIEKNGHIMWRDAKIGQLVKSDAVYAPRVKIDDSDLLNVTQKTHIHTRVTNVIHNHIQTVLAPLMRLSCPDKLITRDRPEDPSDTSTHTDPSDEQVVISGHVKAIFWQIYEAMGTVSRQHLLPQINHLTDADRIMIARADIRLGVEHVYVPYLLKPASIALRIILWCVYNGISPPSVKQIDDGVVSFSMSDVFENIPIEFWQVVGYHKLGSRLMRVDMIERLSALVRAASRAGPFHISDDMLSFAGVSRKEMLLILADLGYAPAPTDGDSEIAKKSVITLFERIRTKQKQDRKKPTAYKRTGKPQAKTSRRHAQKPSVSPRHRSKIAQQQINPHSPFSVLAALKNK